jgi:putative hydrolase of the HAD superfamily
MVIRALLVDAGGTLVLPDHATVLEVLRAIGIAGEPARLDDAHYAGMAAFDRLATNDDGAALVYRRAYADAAGIPSDRVDDAVTAFSRLSATHGHWVRPIPGARDALEAARRAGLPIVIVSNTERGDAAEQLARAGICQVGPGEGVPVDAIVDSAILGRAKPDPLMFETALAAVEVPAGAAIHVGDSLLADVRGAERAGVEAVHVDPLARCPDRTHPHIASIAELPDLLGFDAAGRPLG